MKIMHLIFSAFVLNAAIPGAVRAESNLQTLETLGEKITEKIPVNWKLVATKKNELPWGHYWEGNYGGKKGLSLTFAGSSDVLMVWNDRSGNLHQNALAKEALTVWIMPSDYEESWRRFLSIGRPKPAELIYSSEQVKIYGMPDHFIGTTEREKFEDILRNDAAATSWPDSPLQNGILSWVDWKKDIRALGSSVR